MEDKIQEIDLNAEDGLKIKADFYSSGGDQGIILLHMFTHERKDWKKFALFLQEKGCSVITIDLRGAWRK